MSRIIKITRNIACLALFSTFIPSTFATVITKAGTGTDLTAGASWGGTAPGSADNATWASTSLGVGLTMGASSPYSTSLTWLVMTVNGSASSNPIDVSGTGTLTLGSTASQTTVFTIASTGVNVTFNNPVVAASSGSSSGGAQFSVASGKTLTFNNSIGADAAGHQVQFNGSGTVYLNGTGSFTSGGANISGNGTVSFANANAFNGATFLQMAGSTGNGTLVYTGTGGNFLGIDIRYTSTSTAKFQIIDQSGSGTLTFPGNGTTAFNATANGSHTIQLQGSTAGVGVISGVINNNGTVNVIKTGSGTWTLSAANTFVGGVSLNQGQLNINNASALGTTAGTFTISGSAGAVSIDNTSAGAITLVNYPQAWNADFTFIGTKDLNLGNGNVTLNASRNVTVNGGTLTVGGIISGSTFGLTKKGAGTLALSGVNTYSGATTVRNGTLTISGGSLAAGSVVDVSAADGNANLAGVGTINGAVTLDASGTFTAGINLQNGSAGTLTLAGGLTLNSGNVLNFDFLSGAADKIAMTGGAYTKNSGDVTINILVAATGLAVGTYDLITATGLNATNGFVLGTVPSNSSFKYALTATTGKLQLSVANNTSTPSVAYWTGGIDGTWSTADSGGNFNWASDSTGATTAGGAPGLGITAVTFSANSPANESTTLGADFDILSLTFTSPNTVAIAGANTLTIENGITKSSGSGTATISASTLALGGDQMLANNSSTALSISSVISGAHTLTINSSGSGTTTLSGANSQSGIAVQNGTLALSGSGTLGSSSATVNVSGGTLDLGTLSQTVGGVTVSGGTLQNGTVTGTSYALQAGTVSAALNGTGVALTKSTSGTATLSGNNGYTGGTTISAGTLAISGSGQLGGGSYAGAISDNGMLNYGSSAAQTLSGIISGSGALTDSGSGTLTLAAANTYAGNTAISAGTLQCGVANAIPSGSGKGDVTVNGALDLNGFSSGINGLNGSGMVSNSAAGAATLTVGNNNSSSTFSGDIMNGVGTVNITKTGTGTLILGGTNTFTGNVQVSGGGILSVSSISNALGSVAGIILGGSSANGTLLYTGPGEASDRIIKFTAFIAGASQTIDQSGSGLLKFVSNYNYSGGITNILTLQGSTSGAGEFAGNIGGGTAVGITKGGTGKWTLSGTNTYAAPTLVNSGTLALSGSGSISNTPLISVAGGAIFDVSALNTTFVLGASQTLSNNASATGVLAGNINTGSGTVAVTFANGTPAFTVTNGTLTLSAGTIFKINNTGSALGVGTYKVISKATSGNVGTVAGVIPTALTVSGAGVTEEAMLQIIDGELYLAVGGTTLSLSSSKNPSGFGDNVNFTASVQTNGVVATDATGTMTFETNGVVFDTVTVASGSATSASLNQLPRGTHIITAIYSGDVTYLASSNTLSQIVTNHPPLAGIYNISRTAGISSLKIALSTLSTNWSEADGDTISFVSASASTNGVVISTNGGYILYNNTNNVDDQFTYVISDSYGATATGVVNIVVSGGNASSQNIASEKINGDGTITLNLAGIPGYSYRTQASTNLTDWVDISTNTAGSNGLWQVNDSDATNYPSRYYRTVYP